MGNSRPDYGLVSLLISIIVQKESGYDITVANPKGGYTPIDPESLKAIFFR